MDISFLGDYINLITLGICLCIGYVIKTSLDFIPNKYIPFIMLILGIFINLIVNYQSITPSVVLGGMISGLSSTGLHETMRNLINKGGKNIEK